jgi:hypothetical protein
MGLGGPFLFISSMQLSNAFPRNSGQVLSILTGSFDASSSVFLLYRLAYYNGFKISPHKFFMFYLSLPVLSILVQFTFMPRYSYKSEFEIAAEAHESRNAEPQETSRLLAAADEHTQHRHSHYGVSGAVESQIVEAYGSARRASVFTIPKNRRVSYDSVERNTRSINLVTGAMHGKKSLEQIKSPWWMYLLFQSMLI